MANRNFCLSLRRLRREVISEEALNMVNVAQLVRALDCGSKGRGFESHLSPIHSFTRLSRFERGSLSVSMPVSEPKRWVFEPVKFHLGLFFIHVNEYSRKSFAEIG